MAKVVEVTNEPGSYLLDCPGCECNHQIFVDAPQRPSWTFNRDVNRPTFTPSLLVRHWKAELDGSGEFIWDASINRYKGKDIVCHSFITDGKIQFLDDCTHELKGQTVDLPEIS